MGGAHRRAACHAHGVHVVGAIFEVAARLHVRHHFSGPHVDYLAVSVGAFVSWVGVMGVGEAALIAAGIAAAEHKIDLGGVLAVAWLGATLGGMTGWAIGVRGGRPLMTSAGPLLRLRLRLLRHGDEIYERRGALAVYFAPSWMAGISGMRGRRYMPLNAASCLAWSLLVGGGAYLTGPSIGDVLSDIGTGGLVALALIAVAAWLAKRRRHRRRAGR
jgi:membrane protein DedA with SNARE-associated domain